MRQETMSLLSPAKAKSFPSGRNLKHNGRLEGKLLLFGGNTSTTLASSRRHSQNLLKNHSTQPGLKGHCFWFLASRIRPPWKSWWFLKRIVQTTSSYTSMYQKNASVSLKRTWNPLNGSNQTKSSNDTPNLGLRKALLTSQKTSRARCKGWPNRNLSGRV